MLLHPPQRQSLPRSRPRRCTPLHLVLRRNDDLFAVGHLPRQIHRLWRSVAEETAGSIHGALHTRLRRKVVEPGMPHRTDDVDP